jgi:cardiolipin synthase (CMP-forming)
MSSSSSSHSSKCGPKCPCKAPARPVALTRFLKLLPNLLTTLRLCLLPVYVWFVTQGAYGTAALIYIGALITDIDGHIARRYGGVTKFGAVFDPVVDALFMIVALGMLISLGRVGLAPVAAYVVSVAFRALPSLAHFRATQLPASTILSKTIAFCGFSTVVLATLGVPLLVTAIILAVGTVSNIILTIDWLRRGKFSL